LSEQAKPFAQRGSIGEVEEGLAFAPKFAADGLITCVATDARSGDVLMVAHMNGEALQRTIATGEAWYFSRSRRALWKKGETSGHVQRVVEMRIDCDQDAVWIKAPAPATPAGARASIVRCRSARAAQWRSSSGTARSCSIRRLSTTTNNRVMKRPPPRLARATGGRARGAGDRT
jgi:phosphoribosyl-AMP cyclohydrolase